MGYEDFEDYEDEELEMMDGIKDIEATENPETELKEEKVEEISFGSRSREAIAHEIKDVQAKYTRSSEKYDQLTKDQSEGWIGLQPSINDREGEMSYYKSKIAELERELDRAKE